MKKPGRPNQHGATKGKSKTPEYRTWSHMKNRCLNPNEPAYPRYGGRGIRVCERWMVFENFLADMGPRPTPRHTIDRFPDNDGDYEPGNCRWATYAEQNSNYSRNRRLTLNGETRLLSEWGASVGIDPRTITARLNSGWTVEKAITAPVGSAVPHPGKDRSTHCVNGHEYTPENSGRNAAGWRFCRVCSRARQREYMRASRARKKN